MVHNWKDTGKLTGLEVLICCHMFVAILIHASSHWPTEWVNISDLQLVHNLIHPVRVTIRALKSVYIGTPPPPHNKKPPFHHQKWILCTPWKNGISTMQPTHSHNYQGPRLSKHCKPCIVFFAQCVGHSLQYIYWESVNYLIINAPMLNWTPIRVLTSHTAHNMFKRHIFLR